MKDCSTETIIFSGAANLRRGDVFSRAGYPGSYRVLKVYLPGRWTRLLRFLGFWVPVNGVKIKPVKS
jgi:hypothetical protein